MDKGLDSVSAKDAVISSPGYFNNLLQNIPSRDDRKSAAIEILGLYQKVVEKLIDTGAENTACIIMDAADALIKREIHSARDRCALLKAQVSVMQGVPNSADEIDSLLDAVLEEHS